MLHRSWLLLCTSLPQPYRAPSLMTSSVHQPTSILLCSIPHDFFCAPAYLNPIVLHSSWPLLCTSLPQFYNAPSLMSHDLFCAPAYLSPIVLHPSWPLLCISLPQSYHAPSYLISDMKHPNSILYAPPIHLTFIMHEPILEFFHSSSFLNLNDNHPSLSTLTHKRAITMTTFALSSFSIFTA